MMPYYVGIDGGGTKTAVELRTRGSAAHSRAVFGPLNCNSDRTAAAKALTDTLAWLAANRKGWPGAMDFASAAQVSATRMLTTLFRISSAQAATLARCKSLATRSRRWPVPWASRWALC